MHAGYSCSGGTSNYTRPPQKTLCGPTASTISARSSVKYARSPNDLCCLSRKWKITKQLTTISYWLIYFKSERLGPRVSGRLHCMVCSGSMCFCVHVKISNNNHCPCPSDSHLDQSLFVRLTQRNTSVQLTYCRRLKWCWLFTYLTFRAISVIALCHTLLACVRVS